MTLDDKIGAVDLLREVVAEVLEEPAQYVEAAEGYVLHLARHDAPADMVQQAHERVLRARANLEAITDTLRRSIAPPAEA